MSDRAFSILASIVGAAATVWYYHDVAMTTGPHGDLHFPWIPAILASTAIVVALYVGTRQRAED